MARSKRGRDLLEGFQDFFDLSEELAELLDSMDAMPLHRGMMWLHFGYWYGGGGKRMRDTADWLTDALDRVPDIDRSADAALVRDLMARLTDPLHYAAVTIQCAGPVLDRWRQHALGDIVKLWLRPS